MRHQNGFYPLFILASFASGVVFSVLFSHHLGPVVRQECVQTDSHFYRKLSSCVCDREAENLKRIARLVLMQSQVTPNGSCLKETPVRVSPSINLTEFKNILYPSNPHLYPGAPMGVPKLLRQEYMMKKAVVVGVLTQQEYLATRARAVYETWGKEVSKVVFFVGEDCNISAELSYLPIIRLQGIPDHVYPPLSKAFAVMQYMYDHFLNEFNWFVRADDDMYVRGEKLINLLKDMDPYERVYLGRAGMGRHGHIDGLHLLPHERYCMGGPGVIFSYATLISVGPYLTECLHATFSHNKHSPDKWIYDDVEIGRCISRNLNFQCSTSNEGREYFFHDYTSDALNPQTLWHNPLFSKLITLHPLKQPEHLYAVHHFYEVERAQKVKQELQKLQTSISALCDKMPSSLYPPWQIMESCTV